MARSLTRFNLGLTINALQVNTNDLSTAKDALSKSYTMAFANGEGANQAEEFWSDTRTLAATTADNLDMAGALVSSLGLGSTITFKALKAIIIVHKTPAASAPMKVGGHATLALATMFSSADTLDNDQPSINVRPGGWLVLASPDATGYVVTATTEDMLTVYNGGAGSIDYDIILLGTI